MTPLARAYRDWKEAKSLSPYACCYRSHFSDGNSLISEPLPDDLVCEKERAWRRVVRLRDGKPGWMPGSEGVKKDWASKKQRILYSNTL